MRFIAGRNQIGLTEKQIAYCAGAVEPSGVVMHEVCDVQTEHCTAKAGGALTAVWGPPGRTQINVCRACLEEKMRRGDWEVAGAKLRQPV